MDENKIEELSPELLESIIGVFPWLIRITRSRNLYLQ